MSYVRWSTPISLPEGVSALDYMFDREGRYEVLPTSDFYIYDHGGFVSVSVAGNRHRPTKPFIGAKVVDDEGKPASSGRASEAWLKWLDEGRERIDHPAAGETFEFADMADAIAKVEELIGEGFQAPDWLLDSMREELAEDAGTKSECENSALKSENSEGD